MPPLAAISIIALTLATVVYVLDIRRRRRHVADARSTVERQAHDRNLLTTITANASNRRVTPDQLFTQIGDVAAQLLGARLCSLWRAADACSAFVCVCAPRGSDAVGRKATELQVRTAFPQFRTGVLRTAEGVVRAQSAEAYAAFGVDLDTNLLAVALTDNGGLGGFVLYGRPAKESWTSAERSLAYDLAAVISTVEQAVHLRREHAAADACCRRLLNDADAPLARVAPTGVIRWVNDACCQLLRTTRDQLVGANLMDNLPDAARAGVASLEPEQNSRQTTHSWSSNGAGPVTLDARWEGLFDERGDLVEHLVRLQVVRSRPEPAAPQRAPALGSLNGATVLVIDDEEAVRDVVSLVLEQRGATVLTADDGPTGLDVFRTRSPEIDLVLLDVLLPTMRGRDVYRELKSIRPDVRILLASGNTEADVIGELSDERPAGFVSKPFTPAALVQALCDATP